MPIPCNRCDQPLPKWELAQQDAVMCPECGAESTVRVFPTLFYSKTGPVATEAAGEGESTCFDHATKRAVAACGHCGRFVCSLCAVEFKDGIWCPACFTAGDFRKQDSGFQNSRTLYDSIALTLALAPLLIWPITLLSAPAALYVALRYWKRPKSLVRRIPWRGALAAFMALAEMTGWIWLTAYLVMKARI